MTDPSKKVYNSIHEALLDYARLGKKTYDEMKPNEKQKGTSGKYEYGDGTPYR